MGSAKTKKRAVVVGAGPCGLVAAKELREAGLDVLVVERSAQIGGVFAATRDAAYDSLHLTTSNYFMAYSDFPPKEGETMKYWNKGAYNAYLQDYIAHHALHEVIELETEVTRAEKSGDGTWRVTLTKRSVSSGDEATAAAAVRVEAGFDALVVATGANHEPKRPSFAGFKGEQLHSSDYRDPASFVGRHVVVVGSGESAADIAPEIANSGAASCVMWTRRVPAFVPRFPAIAGTPGFDEWATIRDADRDDAEPNNVPDFLETVATSRMLADTSVALRGKNLQEFFRASLTDKNPTMRLMAKLAIEQTKDHYWRCDLAGWVTKNSRPLAAFVAGSVGLCVSATMEPTADGRGVVFPEVTCDANGPCARPRRVELPRVDAIVWCTGYRTVIDWLQPAVDLDPRLWYKHCFPPGFPDASLAFVGWARGHQGGIPVMAELLSRYHALLLTDDRYKLPEDYSDLARREGDAETTFFPITPCMRSLVDYPSFADSVAKLIGCKPTLWTFVSVRAPFLTITRLFQYYFFPIWSCWYRFVGPGARSDTAHRVLDRFPLGRKSLTCSRNGGIPLIGAPIPQIIGVVLMLLQKPISFLTVTLLPAKYRASGLGSGWILNKPKHYVLHGNDMAPWNVVAP